MKLFSSFLLLFLMSQGIFCGGTPERNSLTYRKYIIEKPLDYEYIGYGLYKSSLLSDYPDRTYIYYNENFNDKITSSNKINENIQIALVGFDTTNTPSHLLSDYKSYKYNIVYKQNFIKINIYSNNAHEIINIYFDKNTNRLLLINSNYPFIFDFQSENCNEYSFIYNDNGRIDSIYAIYKWGNILRKKYYYDGNPRRLYRPYFIKQHTTGLEEITVYDNSVLKYITKLYNGGIGTKEKSMEEEERNHHFTLTEYENNFEIVRIVAYYEGEDYYEKREKDIVNIYPENNYREEIEFFN